MKLVISCRIWKMIHENLQCEHNFHNITNITSRPVAEKTLTSRLMEIWPLFRKEVFVLIIKQTLYGPNFQFLRNLFKRPLSSSSLILKIQRRLQVVNLSNKAIFGSFYHSRTLQKYHGRQDYEIILKPANSQVAVSLCDQDIQLASEKILKN